MTQIESSESAANVIAVFGSGNLVKQPNGKLELCGGTQADFIEAREWASMFMPEVIVAVLSRLFIEPGYFWRHRETMHLC